MKDLEDEVFDFIKKTLKKADYTINLEEFNKNTDLASIGVESIVIVTLIADIEEKFKISITLSNLEKYDYIVSVKSICASINDEKS